VGGGGKFEIVYGFLNSVDIGDVRVSNVPIYIRRMYASGRPVDGYLGLSVIARYIATIDYGNTTLTLQRQRGNTKPITGLAFINDGKPTDVAKEALLDVPMRITRSGFLSGEVRLGGIDRPLNFIIDTGADVSVIAESFYKTENIEGVEDVARMRVYGAAGVLDNVTTLVLPSVTLGAHVREDIRAAVIDLESVNETAGFNQAGIIGANFLRTYRVIFDFQRGVMRLEQLRREAPKKETSSEGTVPESP